MTKNKQLFFTLCIDRLALLHGVDKTAAEPTTKSTSGAQNQALDGHVNDL